MADFKKLTTGEDAGKRFTPVRMREGYSMEEVDEFLEAVEQTIDAYNQEIIQYRQAYEKLKSAPPQDNGELATTKAALTTTKEELDESTRKIASLQETVEIMANQLIEARAEVESVRASHASANPMDPSNAPATVARMLESAAKSHDDLVAQGEAEALRLKAEAEEEAEEIIRKAQKEAEALQLEAEKAKNKVIAAIAGQKQDVEDTLDTLLENVKTRLALTHDDVVTELSGEYSPRGSSGSHSRPVPVAPSFTNSVPRFTP